MIRDLFTLQNNYRQKTKNTSANERIDKLDKIQNWILSNRERIKTAIYKDFKKPYEETDLTEIYPVLAEIKHAKKNLKKWMKEKYVGRTLVYIAHKAYIKYEAKGNALIISPWNYPFMLAIGPLISAIAAGNVVIIKPSELASNTSQLIEEMITELFDNKEIAVVQGDKNIVAKLMSMPFDHIFFTGNTDVGKIIAKSASENLTSFTLELGGKSPVIIDDSAELNLTAEKIVWGKFINKGQTCVAPDYILVDKKVRKSLVEKIIQLIKNIYGNNNSEINLNKDYARIINSYHQKRLTDLVENSTTNGNKILFGGNYDSEHNFIEPTIILNNCKNCKIFEDEIFGPVLPIVEYNKIEEAIDLINKINIPLAIYIFSKNKKAIKKIVNLTQSGGVGINELVLQFSHPNLPFGGVRHSGIGRSHGFAGFKEFSNERSFIKGGKFNLLKIIYPPYVNKKQRLIDFFVKYL